MAQQRFSPFFGVSSEIYDAKPPARIPEDRINNPNVIDELFEMSMIFSTNVGDAPMKGEQNTTESGSAPTVGPVLETALYVADLGRSVAFYEQVLGLPPASEPGSRMCALRITASQVLLLFRKGGSVQATVTSYGTIPPTDGDGSLHLTFFIPGPNFEIWQDRLRRFEVEIESILTWPTGGRSIYFRDPDNHLIELKTSRWQGKELQSESELSGL